MLIGRVGSSWVWVEPKHNINILYSYLSPTRPEIHLSPNHIIFLFFIKNYIVFLILKIFIKSA